MTKEEALEEVRKNRLNDLSMQGISFITGTADVVDLGIAVFLTEHGDDRDLLLKVYAVLDKEAYEDKTRSVGYYIAWIFTEDKENSNKWASFGWVREYLGGVYELAEAIEKLNFKTYSEYREI